MPGVAQEGSSAGVVGNVTLTLVFYSAEYGQQVTSGSTLKYLLVRGLHNSFLRMIHKVKVC